MDSSNIDNRSKSPTSNKFKRLLYNYYPIFSKISKIGENPNQFIALLYNCVPSLSQFWSIDKILKNDNVSELGMGKNQTTLLYSATTKRENIFKYQTYKNLLE